MKNDKDSITLGFFIIDHHDSFTYNLRDLLYRVCPSSNIDLVSSDQNALEDTLISFIGKNRYACIVFSPGGGSPQDQLQSISIYQKYHHRCSFLGICLGHQIIGYAHGFSIIRSKYVVHGSPIDVIFDLDARHCINSHRYQLGCYNSLVLSDVQENISVINVDPSVYYNSIKVIARDQFDQIAAIENDVIVNSGLRQTSPPMLGIQHHPESFLSIDGDNLIRVFVGKCKRYFKSIKS